MKRSIWIFLLAIVLPSVGLGWLALRSANEQQIVLERRTAELYQKETDAVASAARSLIDEERRTFAERVRQLLADASAPELARDFAAKSRARSCAEEPASNWRTRPANARRSSSIKLRAAPAIASVSFW